MSFVWLGGIDKKPEGILNAERINVECRSWGGWEEVGVNGRFELVEFGSVDAGFFFTRLLFLRIMMWSLSECFLRFSWSQRD